MGPCFFLVTWNPDNQSWDELFDEAFREIRKGYTWFDNWSLSTNYRRIKHGDGLWFLRQGREPRGIFAYATVV